MKILNTIAKELFGLFVDDGNLTIATLALLGTIALLMHQALMGKGVAATVLVVGSILILIENDVRTSRRSMVKQKDV